MNYQPKFNEQKATEVASILLDLKGGRVEYLWLMKMLYIIERESYNKWERPIIYDDYRSMDKGPVLMTVYNLITGRYEGTFWKKCILTFPKKSAHKYEVCLNGTLPKIRNLSESEVSLIREKFDEFKDLDRWDLVELTHRFPEWTDPHGGPSIPIYVDYLLEKLNYSAADIQRISREIKEEAALDEILGV